MGSNPDTKDSEVFSKQEVFIFNVHSCYEHRAQQILEHLINFLLSELLLHRNIECSEGGVSDPVVRSRTRTSSEFLKLK